MDQDSSQPTGVNTTCPVPLNELARPQALQDQGILDPSAEDVFDSAVRQAPNAGDTTMSLLSLVGRDPAIPDNVTPLANRRSFESRLAGAMRRVRCSKKSLALVMIEMDRLADIRHTYGHELADDVLAGFATRLKECATTNDDVAHLGGDEFVILVEGVNGTGAMPSLVALIHQKMEPCFRWEQCQIPFSASVGVVYFAGGDEDTDALLVRAADAVNIAVLNGSHQQIMPLPGADASAGMRTRGSFAGVVAASGR